MRPSLDLHIYILIYLYQRHTCTHMQAFHCMNGGLKCKIAKEKRIEREQEIREDEERRGERGRRRESAGASSRGPGPPHVKDEPADQRQ